MRRTLFVVPRELVPVVEAACTRAIAERERRRLEQWVAASGISTQPAAWVRRAMSTALRAVETRGEAFTADLTRSIPTLGKRLHVGQGTRWEATQSAGSRILPQLAMEGRIVRGRPRGGWVNGQYRWTPLAEWLGGAPPALDPAPSRADLTRCWLGAFGPATETRPPLVDRLDRPRCPRRARLRTRTRASTSTEASGSCSRTTSLPSSAPAPSAALLPTLDPTTMGWKERSWYLGPHGRVLFDANGNAGPTVWWDGRVVGGWSQRRDGEIAFKLVEDVGRGRRSRRGGRGREARLVGRRCAHRARVPPALPAGALRLSLSRRAAGRSPSRSRAAGSATSPRRSGRASRRA